MFIMEISPHNSARTQPDFKEINKNQLCWLIYFKSVFAEQEHAP